MLSYNYVSRTDSAAPPEVFDVSEQSDFLHEVCAGSLQHLQVPGSASSGYETFVIGDDDSVRKSGLLGTGVERVHLNTIVIE